MANLSCDLCNGKLIIGTGGIASCENCGMEYSNDRMREKAQENKGSVEVSNIAGIESLMKRGHLFLEDSDWQQANIYFDRALDINPEYAPAYIGKLCAELEIRNESYLSDAEIPLSNISSFQKAIRFSDNESQIKLRDFEEITRKRFEEKERIVQQAKIWFNNNDGFPLCWHCGGKLKSGIFGSYDNSQCKQCGKINNECFLCGGVVDRDEVDSNKAKRHSYCKKCGVDFHKLGIRFNSPW